MLIRPLSIIARYIDNLDLMLKCIHHEQTLTNAQKAGFVWILAGILMTGQLNWDAFERKSGKQCKASRLRWLFHHAAIPWQVLLRASVRYLIKYYNVQSVSLLIDDTHKKRAKSTKKIDKSHKIKDKSTGGYCNGQQIVFLVVSTPLVTFPVGFHFYQPEPAQTAWHKENKRLKKRQVSAKNRPKRPVLDTSKYPTKEMLALALIEAFVEHFPDIKVVSVLADALYGTGRFMDKASSLTQGAQVVSQLRQNQVVYSRNSRTKVSTYFKRQPGVKTHLTIRGGEEKQVTLLGARLRIRAT